MSRFDPLQTLGRRSVCFFGWCGVELCPRPLATGSIPTRIVAIDQVAYSLGVLAIGIAWFENKKRYWVHPRSQLEVSDKSFLIDRHTVPTNLPTVRRDFVDYPVCGPSHGRRSPSGKD